MRRLILPLGLGWVLLRLIVGPVLGSYWWALLPLGVYVGYVLAICAAVGAIYIRVTPNGPAKLEASVELYRNYWRAQRAADADAAAEAEAEQDSESAGRFR